MTQNLSEAQRQALAELFAAQQRAEQLGLGGLIGGGEHTPFDISAGVLQRLGFIGSLLQMALGAYVPRHEFIPMGRAPTTFSALTAQAFDIAHIRALRASAERDWAEIERTISGFAAMLGADAQRILDTNLAPIRDLYVRTDISPELKAAIAMLLTGGRSELAAAARFHVWGRGMIDPVTGRPGLAPYTANVMAAVLTERFFADPLDRLTRSYGLTTRELADAAFELYRRGMAPSVSPRVEDRIAQAFRELGAIAPAPERMQEDILRHAQRRLMDQRFEQLEQQRIQQLIITTNVTAETARQAAEQRREQWREEWRPQVEAEVQRIMEPFRAAVRGGRLDEFAARGAIDPELARVLLQDPTLSSILRTGYAERMASTLERYARAIGEMRKIFGDAGVRDAPMVMVIEQLEKLAGGNLASYDPTRLGQLVGQLRALGATTQIGLEAVQSLQNYVAQMSQRMEVAPEFILPATMHGMAMAGALARTGALSRPAFRSLSERQFVELEAARYLRGTESEAAQRIGLLVNLAAQHGVEGRNEAQQLVAALRSGQITRLTDEQIRLLLAPRGEFVRRTQELFGLDAAAISAMLTYGGIANVETVFNLGLDPLIYELQGRERQSILAQTLRNAGLSQETADQVVQILREAPKDVLRRPMFDTRDARGETQQGLIQYVIQQLGQQRDAALTEEERLRVQQGLLIAQSRLAPLFQTPRLGDVLLPTTAAVRHEMRRLRAVADVMSRAENALGLSTSLNERLIGLFHQAAAGAEVDLPQIVQAILNVVPREQLFPQLQALEQQATARLRSLQEAFRATIGGLQDQTPERRAQQDELQVDIEAVQQLLSAISRIRQMVLRSPQEAAQAGMPTEPPDVVLMSYPSTVLSMPPSVMRIAGQIEGMLGANLPTLARQSVALSLLELDLRSYRTESGAVHWPQFIRDATQKAQRSLERLLGSQMLDEGQKEQIRQFIRAGPGGAPLLQAVGTIVERVLSTDEAIKVLATHGSILRSAPQYKPPPGVPVPEALQRVVAPPSPPRAATSQLEVPHEAAALAASARSAIPELAPPSPVLPTETPAAAPRRGLDVAAFVEALRRIEMQNVDIYINGELAVQGAKAVAVSGTYKGFAPTGGIG